MDNEDSTRTDIERRVYENGRFLKDRVSGMITSVDWRCPKCRAVLSWIDTDGECFCLNGHVSR